MIYQVKAKFNFDKAKEFYQKLTDGTISSQRPDGQEIIDSMNRAVIDEEENILWTELCYCTPPLDHERKTVYDLYFSEIITETVSEYKKMSGESFIKKLTEHK